MEEFVPPEGGGLVVFNPPYGERIIKQDIDRFYAMIGERLKHNFSGYDVWLLSSNMEALKNIGLHPAEGFPL